MPQAEHRRASRGRVVSEDEFVERIRSQQDEQIEPSDLARAAVIDRGKPMDDIDAVTTLTHEFVHALQDSELDLEHYRERWGKTYDSALALTRLLEGEAVHYELLASLDERGLTSSGSIGKPSTPNGVTMSSGMPIKTPLRSRMPGCGSRMPSAAAS